MRFNFLLTKSSMLPSLENLTLACRKLSILDYPVDMHIGVYDEEKGHTQPVVFTVDVWVSLTDETQNYWDYTTIVKAVDAIVASGHIGLQEEIHEALFEALFADDMVCAARILTKKTKALAGAAAAAVETFKFHPNAR